MGFIVLEWCAKNQSATPDHQFHERYLSDFELVSMSGTMTVDAENGSSQLLATRNDNGSLWRVITHALADSSTARGLAGNTLFISVRSCGEAPEVRGPKRSAEVTSKQIEGLLQENLPAAMTGRHLRSRDLRGRQLRAHAVRRAHKGLQFLERHEARQRL